MYHTQKINQAPIEKNLKQTGFSSQNLQTAHFTPTEQRIVREFEKFHSSSRINPSNAYIAHKVGCSIITVIRATNKFHKNGLILKHQDHQYSTNNYTFGIKVDHKNKKVIQCEYDIPNKNSSLLLDSLFRNSCVDVLTREARNNRHLFFQKIKGKIVNSVQKQLILAHRSDPTLKDILRKPQVMSEIINEPLEKLTKLLALDEKEQFKLVPFNENTLEHVLAEIEPVINGEKPARHNNRMEWLLGIAKDYCKKNNINPDWGWYYGLCEILGIGTKTTPKPFFAKQRPVGTPQKGIYAPWKSPDQDSEDKLVAEIESCKIKLANPDKYFKFCREQSIKYIQSYMQQCIDDLTKLRDSSNAKQNISYQRNTYSLDPCSA